MALTIHLTFSLIQLLLLLSHVLSLGVL